MMTQKNTIKAKVICCCNKAHHGCEDTCSKGVALTPESVIFVSTWQRKKLKYETKGG